MAGYSGTPLAKKLGFKPGMRVVLVNAPDNYLDLLGTLPDGIVIKKRASAICDFVQIFATRRRRLEASLRSAICVLERDGMLWVSWPKQSSGIASDLGENQVREIGLASGLVDIKVCAVDETWSGLKFVYRRSDR